ncbi:MAG TPA: GtrA family protein [Solirubrobacteraceae bacterium]|jgi:putative flippase GtrA|nr:GtrA family protein [Solirubrobacteraceae bacterium]
MCALAVTGWRDDPLVRQFLKYGVVGASNTVLTFITYTILVVALGVPYPVALVVGYLVGSFNSYVFNRHWTFRARDLAHSQTGLRFGVVQAGAIGANELLLYVFVHALSVAKVPAQAILTVPVLAVTFFVNRWWSFARPPEEREPPPAAS